MITLPNTANIWRWVKIFSLCINLSLPLSHIPFIIMCCPGLLPRQILLIFPQTKVIQRPPENPVQPVLLLVICWVRTIEASQEFWRHLHMTQGSQRQYWHMRVYTMQHRILGAILYVASRMSNVMWCSCTLNSHLKFMDDCIQHLFTDSMLTFIVLLAMTKLDGSSTHRFWIQTFTWWSCWILKFCACVWLFWIAVVRRRLKSL